MKCAPTWEDVGSACDDLSFAKRAGARARRETESARWAARGVDMTSAPAAAVDALEAQYAAGETMA